MPDREESLCVFAQSGYFLKLRVDLGPTMRRLDSFGRSADEHFFFFVNAVDLFWGWGEEDLEAAPYAGHDGGDLTGGDDYLLIDKFGRIGDLVVGAVDGAADHFDLVFCGDGGFANELP